MAEQHTFPTTFSFKSCQNVRGYLLESGFQQVDIQYFAETQYRFRYWRILEIIALWYTKATSTLGLNIIKSLSVIIARK